jgi:hypothetical protein
MPPKSKECFSSPKDKKRSKKRQQLKATNCEQNKIMDNNLRIAQQNSSALQIQVIKLIENYNKTKSYEIPTF